MQSYKAARGFFSFIQFIAWAAIVLGAFLALIGAKSGASASPLASVLAAAPGILVSMIGCFILVNIQTARATVDSAEYAQQSLKLSRDQFELSKQMLALAQPTSSPSGYAVETAASGLQNVSFDTDATSPTDTIGNTDQTVEASTNSIEQAASSPITDRLEVDTSSIELQVDTNVRDPKTMAVLRKRGAWT